jgi:putative FmdB family regulatory protein
MPIYEYVCEGCGSAFELLVLPGSTASRECPSCHSKELRQEISAFAVSTQEKSQSAWKAARKKYEKTTLRDKKVAEREAAEHHLHDD